MAAATLIALPVLPVTVDAVGHAPAGALAVAAFLDLLPSALGFVIRGYAVTRLPMSVSAAALYLVPPARSSSLSGGLRRCPTSSN